MNTSDAVLSYLPATETIATANEIVKRLGRLNEDVSATDVFATYDAFRREQIAPQREGPRELAGLRSCRAQVQHIIDSIAVDTFTTITPVRARKPAMWMHRDMGGRVIVSDRKGVLAHTAVG